MKPAHRKLTHVYDYIAYGLCFRWSFIKSSGTVPRRRHAGGWLQRRYFLETVAAFPHGRRHVTSHDVLRTLKRDHGWIHTLLEEAENERMHLLTFLKLRQPGIASPPAVLGRRGLFQRLLVVSHQSSHVSSIRRALKRPCAHTHALHDIDGADRRACGRRTPSNR